MIKPPAPAIGQGNGDEVGAGMGVAVRVGIGLGGLVGTGGLVELGAGWVSVGVEELVGAAVTLTTAVQSARVGIRVGLVVLPAVVTVGRTSPAYPWDCRQAESSPSVSSWITS